MLHPLIFPILLGALMGSPAAGQRKGCAFVSCQWKRLPALPAFWVMPHRLNQQADKITWQTNRLIFYMTLSLWLNKQGEIRCSDIHYDEQVLILCVCVFVVIGVQLGPEGKWKSIFLWKEAEIKLRAGVDNVIKKEMPLQMSELWGSPLIIVPFSCFLLLGNNLHFSSSERFSVRSLLGGEWNVSQWQHWGPDSCWQTG